MHAGRHVGRQQLPIDLQVLRRPFELLERSDEVDVGVGDRCSRVIDTPGRPESSLAAIPRRANSTPDRMSSSWKAAISSMPSEPRGESSDSDVDFAKMMTRMGCLL